MTGKPMESTRSPTVTLRWLALRRRRKAMVVVVTTLIMVIQLMRRTLLVEKEAAGTVERVHEPFIPAFPNQVRLGQPADIPRGFLLEEADACLRKGDNLEAVAYVHSAISRVKERRQTRLTWANSTAIKMVVVFMVGRAKNDQEKEIVRRESELYHDIVQGDYGDHYHLLTYKALSSLYWVTRNCAHVPWTLHADDDLLLDTFILRQLLQFFGDSPDKNTLYCRVIKRLSVRRKGKWKVTKKEMKADKYPAYCQGTIWFINTDQVPRLLRASTSVNFLWVDDAYITGILAKRAKIGIFHIGKYIEGNVFRESQVGRKLAWYHVSKQNRTNLWPIILSHHNTNDKGNVP